eukprot:gene8971-6246_t
MVLSLNGALLGYALGFTSPTVDTSSSCPGVCRSCLNCDSGLNDAETAVFVSAITADAMPSNGPAAMRSPGAGPAPHSADSTDPCSSLHPHRLMFTCTQSA